uniref:Uncharacterized protein n=1 Tax=Onchocerca volvulus TaxID=6282 RepID=A0A8R1XNW5_ONCVO
MTFEYDGTSRIKGFTLSICVSPFERSTYSFVLDWDKRNKPKVPSKNDNEKKSSMQQFSMERTIKDGNLSASLTDGLSLVTSLTMKRNRNKIKHFESWPKKQMKGKKQYIDMKNQIYDNSESYDQSFDGDEKRCKHSEYSTKLEKEKQNTLIKVKVIIRYYTYDNETVENIITNKMINSLTLIDALKFLLLNTTISSTCNDYGRLYLFLDGKRKDKIRELPYDQNYYKLLADFCKSGRCTFLLNLTNTIPESSIVDFS